MMEEAPYPIPDFTNIWELQNMRLFKDSGYVNRLVDIFTWEKILRVFDEKSQDWNVLVIEPYGGKLRQVSAKASVLIHRDVDFNIYGNTFYNADVNFHWKYFGDSYSTLLWINQKCDPENFLSFAQSISAPIASSSRRSLAPSTLSNFQTFKS